LHPASLHERLGGKGIDDMVAEYDEYGGKPNKCHRPRQVLVTYAMGT
jgi:hypothetical protein